ncbi:MAG: VIT1/CCC1 transporter family protein [Candidatus Aenigmarchaeota archaeon]|nr:VIT1/CCC1 transporter family protein [Candidatus Aenigmarchaeota archaeon]
MTRERRRHDLIKDNIKDFILGGQDGTVNVLGIVLGVATATLNPSIVIIAGLAATFAESISMGAVGYTTSKTENELYTSGRRKKAVPEEWSHPLKNGLVTMFASFLGSFVPLIPFFLAEVKQAMIISLVLSIIFLFSMGAVKGIITKRSWFRSGAEITIIGILAALAGFLVGYLLGGPHMI